VRFSAQPFSQRPHEHMARGIRRGYLTTSDLEGCLHGQPSSATNCGAALYPPSAETSAVFSKSRLLLSWAGATSMVFTLELSPDGRPPSQSLCDAVFVSVAVSHPENASSAAGGASCLLTMKSGSRQAPPPLPRTGSSASARTCLFSCCACSNCWFYEWRG